MSNLVPELRLDKNQKLVTRHVKPDTGNASSSLRKVSPVLPVSEEGESLSQGLGMRMDSVFLAEKGIRVSDVMKAARRLPSQTAAALNEIVEQTRSNDNVFTNLVASALVNGESPDNLESFTLFYSEYQYQEYDWGKTGAGQYEVILRDLRGLQQMEQFAGVTNFHRADRDVAIAAKSLVSMFELADRGNGLLIETTPEGHEYSKFKDERLIGLVVNNLDQIDAILDAAYEHDGDADMIEKVVNTAPSLRDGIL